MDDLTPDTRYRFLHFLTTKNTNENADLAYVVRKRKLKIVEFLWNRWSIREAEVPSRTDKLKHFFFVNNTNDSTVNTERDGSKIKAKRFVVGV